MAYVRTAIKEFSLSNPLYVGASVTYYTVDSNGVKTATKQTLYAAQTGTTTLSNPQTLDSSGKTAAPVYVDTATIASVTGALLAPDHDTGVIQPALDDAQVARAQNAADRAQSVSAVAEQAAEEAADSAASITLPLAVSSGGTASTTAAAARTALGAVGGPGTSTDNSIPRFGGTAGGTIQDSGVSIDDDDNLYGHGAGVNAQTGTTYTLTAADNGKVVTLDNAAAITLTFPQTSTETLAANFQCVLIAKGAGQVTVAKEGTDTILSKDSNLKLVKKGSVATVLKLTAGTPNAWFLGGDLTA